MLHHSSRTAEVLGWLGAAAFLVGYLLITFGWLDAEGLGYQGLVLIGSTGIVVVSFVKKTYQTAVLNGVFAVIALVVAMKLLM